MRKVMHHAAVGVGTGTTFWDGDRGLNDRERRMRVVEIVPVGTPDFSVQIEQSLDGQAWYAVGDALAAGGLYERMIRTPYFRTRIASFSGEGSLSIFTD